MNLPQSPYAVERRLSAYLQYIRDGKDVPWDWIALDSGRSVESLKAQAVDLLQCYSPCYECSGRGEVYDPTAEYAEPIPYYVECPRCKGYGELEREGPDNA